ncbi:MAG TPA: glycosyltransferase family 2 protein [Chitinophagales bacterium]|nr:glycosyltransferase family 2 protein [Chitinophagales bacterium]
MGNLKFSIVTVCRNAEATIEKTIRSVVEQTHSNIEYILIDAVSTDKTLEIVNKYRDKIAIVISEPDKGIYDAMNKGVAHATGDYVFFLNAGDLLISEYELERINELITADPVGIDVFYGKMLVFDDRNLWGYIHGIDFVSDITLFLDTVHHQTAFTKVALLKERPYDINHKLSADFEWFTYAHAQKKYRFKFNDILVSIFEPYGISGNAAQLNARLMERVSVLKKNYSKTRLFYLLLYNYVRIFKHPANKRKYILELLNQLRVNLFGI